MRSALTSPRWNPESGTRSRLSGEAAEKLDEIPGISLATAHVILAEIGLDMARFPTAGHLVSWARLAPGVKEPAGKKKGRGSTGHGKIYLARVLGNAAGRWEDRYLPGRALPPHRAPPRQQRAIVAIGRSILVIAWHLLSDPDARYRDLGSGFYATRIDPERRKRGHIRQLEALGYTVTLQPAA
jgi:transposase